MDHVSVIKNVRPVGLDGKCIKSGYIQKCRTKPVLRVAPRSIAIDWEFKTFEKWRFALIKIKFTKII